MGFYPDLRKLLKVVPQADRRQTMLFSATLNAWVKNLAWEYTKGSKGGQAPVEIEIKPEIVTVEEITQTLYHVPSVEKMVLLLGLLKREQPESVIVFCNTKKQTEIIAKRLKINGYSCEFIIGDLPQVKRLKIIDNVKSGKIKMLIATDVAARGLDIESLSMVINYDVPAEAENYVHRIGRTARAGKTGKAITLSSEQDVYELPAIERYIGKKIPSEIAMQEMYAEDKSAGMRVHTERYNDAKRDSRKGAEPKARKTLKPQEPQREENVKRRHNKKPQDISHLSMEERMSLYKKKYAGSSTKHIKNKEQSPKKHQNIEQQTEQKQQEPATPLKKGLISKLLGMFKRK
jgi:ATP-dependent RNA helicase RhlB